jgi:hypothetical protein
MHTQFIGKPKGREPLGKPRHRWRTLLKLILKKV